MLQWASKDAIAELLKKPGMARPSVNIQDLSFGDVLRIHTNSGNIYLLEVIDPNKNDVHLYRHESRGFGSDGYRGERTITELLTIGQPISYKHGYDIYSRRTKRIVSILLLS